MFLEKYKVFKNTICEDDKKLYEENSINDFKIFQTYKDYEQPNKDNFITNKFFNEYMLELDKTIEKYKFINSYLEDYESKLIEKSSILDKQINSFSKNSENYSNSFLHLLNSDIDCNNIINTKPMYLKNIEIIDNKSVKNKNNNDNLSCDIRIINSNSFFIYFEELTIVKDIIIDFYNYVEFNIYGVLEDDSLEILFENINNEIPCFVNQIETKYKAIYINSNFNIKNIIKTIIVKKDVKNSNNVYGYLAYKINNLNKFDSIFIESNSETSFYFFYEKDFQKMIKETNENFEKSIPNNFNDINKLDKNTLIQADIFKENFYIVEFFNKDIQFSIIPFIYGKER